MRSRILRVTAVALALVAATVFMPSQAEADAAQKQPEPGSPGAPRGPQAAEDSARWWTLTDEMTPQKLRAIHEDIERHKERYREAVRAGTRGLLPKEQMELLNFFIDGAAHPELFQAWLVFSSFAAGFAFDEIDPRVSLSEFGFDDDVAETIARVSIEFWHEREILQERVYEEMKAVEELARLSKERLGLENYKVAIKARDATMLSDATGYKVDRVEKLLKLWWEETPSADLTVRTLPLIKEALGPAEWERFRSYLLEVQAPKMSSIGFADIEGN